MGRLFNKKSPHPWYGLAVAVDEMLKSGEFPEAQAYLEERFNACMAPAG